MLAQFECTVAALASSGNGRDEDWAEGGVAGRGEDPSPVAGGVW